MAQSPVPSLPTHPEPEGLSRPHGPGKGQVRVQEGCRMKRRQHSSRLGEKCIPSGRLGLSRLEDPESRFQGVASMVENKG